MEHFSSAPNNQLVTSENRERRGEVLQRLMVSARNIDGLDGKTIREVFNSESENTRRCLIDSLSDDQYLQLISGVNGILRGKEKENWKMDGEGVTAAGHEVVGAHIFPRHADKKDILVKTLQAAKEMNASGRELEDIGMLLGSLLVETHPFADGNGRTSRFVYSMVKDGISTDNTEKLKVLLGEDGRDELDMALSKIYIDDLFYKKYANLDLSTGVGENQVVGVSVDNDSTPFGKLSFPEGVPQITQESIIQAGRNDNALFTVALFLFVQQNPAVDYKSCIKDYGERGRFLVQKFFTIVSLRQIEEIEDIYWSIKKKYTEDMIDIFANPDKPEYKIQRKGEEMRMIDYFKKRISEKSILI